MAELDRLKSDFIAITFDDCGTPLGLILGMQHFYAIWLARNIMSRLILSLRMPRG